MQPDLVVDVGNSLIKWGRCADGAVTDKAVLPADDPEAWQKQWQNWSLEKANTWVVTGVHPERREFLVKWLRPRSDQVRIIDSANQLPLQVKVEQPDWVGIDRLLNAVAARAWRCQGAPAVIVDAGSAVTVDCIDETGAFRGGSIFPGLRLMAQALHDHTALLPLVRVESDRLPLPATATIAAMEAGVFWAVAGGIKMLIEELALRGAPEPAAISQIDTYITGGDAPLLVPSLRRILRPTLVERFMPAPFMTLEGIRLSAEALP